MSSSRGTFLMHEASDLLHAAAQEILFVQGAGAGVHAEWDIRLVESLRRELGASYRVGYPQMPDEADPKLAAWQPVIERELATIGPGAVVVGHSVGGTILVRVLAGITAGVDLGAIILLAAPFIGEGGWTSDEMPEAADLGESLPDGVPVLLYHGEDDLVVPVAHLDCYARSIPQATAHRLPGRDHQLNDDLSEVARDIRALSPRPGA